MSNTVDVLKDAVSTGIVEQGLTNSQLPHYTAGLESFDKLSTDVIIVDGTKIEDVVSDAISVTSNEHTELSLTAGQIAVGMEAAKLALDLNQAQSASRNLIPVADSPEVTVVDDTGYSNTEVISIESIGLEAWDGQDVANTAAFQITTNILAAKQSPIGELFFPTVVVPTRQMGLSVTINVDSFQKPFTRSKTGSVDKIEKVSLIKATSDFTNFTIDKTKLVPVLRVGENDGLLLVSEQFVDDSTGVNITTAPIKIDTELSILGISQTDELIAKGVMDDTDALDGALNTKRIYFELTGGGNTEMFYFTVRDGYWTSTKRGHNKDLELDYDNNGLVINTANTKKSDGTASGVLGALPAGYSIKVRVKLSGSGNTETATISIHNNKISAANIITEIRNANGAIVPTTDPAYATIKAVTDTLTVTGHITDAYSINTNLRKSGQIVVRDKYTTVYNLNFRSPVTLRLPYTNTVGTDNSTALILSQVAMLGVRTAASAINTLNDYTMLLKDRKVKGTDNSVSADLGVGGYIVNLYYNNPTIDLKAAVDSIKSGDRMADIRATLQNLIWDELSAMVMESNFKTAIAIQNGGMVGKIDVKLAVPTRLFKFVSSLDFGDEYNVQVAIPQYQAENTVLGDRILMTLSYGKNNGIATNPLSFGNMAWSPEYSVDVVKTVSNSTYREKSIVPRFGHFVHLPIMAEFSITNLNDVLNKVTQHRKTI